MKKISLFLMFVLLGFGVIVQTAQAQLTVAPDLKLQIGTGGAIGPAYNARHVISPYAQVTANATYTFIGISHPSLDSAHTTIGLAVEAMDMVTVPNNSAGRAAVFTVKAGETHRVFIVNQSHATINANNGSPETMAGCRGNSIDTTLSNAANASAVSASPAAAAAAAQ